MRAPVTLPRISGFRLHGFAPIFRRSVEMSLLHGPNIILGGNGLGKTTIVQAIVYGLTGGTASTEEHKQFRWDHSYFRGRLHTEQDARIEVDFNFGRRSFSVRRGFSGSEVAAFRAGTRNSWIEDTRRAEQEFLRAIQEYGGYENADDFSFVVNRLMYLPENRRLVAWDTDAQTRLLMLLNQDISPEDPFRKHREDLQLLDSRKRHTHVSLGKVSNQILELEHRPEGGSELRSAPHNQEESSSTQRILAELKKTVRQHAQARERLEKASQALSEISEEIEKLRDRIETVEAALVQGFLSKQEREKSLALHKMAENGICPICGVHQPDLQAQAQSRARSGHCMFCDSELPQDTSSELSTLRSQLAEKVRARDVLEQEFLAATKELESIMSGEEHLQNELDRARPERPIIALLEREVAPTSISGLRKLKRELENQEAKLELRLLRLRKKLEKEYNRFLTLANVRMERLQRKYTDYATSFLGLVCRLSQEKTVDLMELSIFVPEFQGAVRATPDSCSEAQRFFLDIAFRMALIDTTSSLFGLGGAFICETPETALDMSYVDNVVAMFGQFCNEGHTVLLTTNIQSDGIAKKLLRQVSRGERSRRTLNMLEVGQLSDVQNRALDKLKRAVARTIG